MSVYLGPAGSVICTCGLVFVPSTDEGEALQTSLARVHAASCDGTPEEFDRRLAAQRSDAIRDIVTARLRDPRATHLEEAR